MSSLFSFVSLFFHQIPVSFTCSSCHFLTLFICCTLTQVSRFSCNPDETSAEAWGSRSSLSTPAASKLDKKFRNYTAQSLISISNNTCIFSLISSSEIQKQVLQFSEWWQRQLITHTAKLSWLSGERGPGPQIPSCEGVTVKFKLQKQYNKR